MPQSFTHLSAGVIAQQQVRSVLVCSAPAVERAVREAVQSAADQSQPGAKAGEARRRGEPYAREVVHRSDAGEVLLAWWWAGASCAAHDHGGAQGSVVVLRGHFQERSFAFDGGRLHRIAQRELSVGECIAVAPDAIHAMSAREHGVTLHVYTASTRHMRVYDATSRTTWLIGEDGGAWLPASTSQHGRPWANQHERP